MEANEGEEKLDVEEEKQEAGRREKDRQQQQQQVEEEDVEEDDSLGLEMRNTDSVFSELSELSRYYLESVDQGASVRGELVYMLHDTCPVSSHFSSISDQRFFIVLLFHIWTCNNTILQSV